MAWTKDTADQLRLLIENVREFAVLTMDEDRRITTWNLGAEQILGLAEKDAIGMPGDLIFTDEDRAAGAPEAEAAAAQRFGEARDERWHLRADGSRFWGSGVMTALYDEAGRAHGFAKLLRDETERREAERARAESEAQLQFVLEAADVGLWSINLSTGEADRSPLHDAIFGYPEPLPKWTYEQFLSHVLEEDRDEVAAQYGLAIERGEEWNFECRIRRADEVTRWIHAVGWIWDVEGEPRRMFGTVADVTDRKGTEQARAESDARYRALFTQAPAFIAMLKSPEHRFEFVNPAYVRLVGGRELLGKTVREALPEVEGQGLFEILDLVYLNGETFIAVDRPIDLTREDGKAAQRRFVDFVYQPLRDPDGTVSGVIALGIDTTDRFRAQEAIAQANRKLEQANRDLEQRVEARTAQVRRLAAKLSVAEQEERRRIAHVLHDDLQQQLYGASMALSLVGLAETPEEQAGYVARAEGVISQATKLTRALSAELSPAVLQTDRLSDVVRWLASQQEETYGLAVTVEGDADVGDPALRTLLYHLVREALFNVAKHAGTDRARVVLEESDGSVIVRVEDEGGGFDAAALLADGGYGGFGLASIQERLELVGGRFRVDSAPGEGTRVTLTLPRESQPNG